MIPAAVSITALLKQHRKVVLKQRVYTRQHHEDTSRHANKHFGFLEFAKVTKVTWNDTCPFAQTARVTNEQVNECFGKFTECNVDHYLILITPAEEVAKHEYVCLSALPPSLK